LVLDFPYRLSVRDGVAGYNSGTLNFEGASYLG
jgi:hypothetical protein